MHKISSLFTLGLNPLPNAYIVFPFVLYFLSLYICGICVYACVSSCFCANTKNFSYVIGFKYNRRNLLHLFYIFYANVLTLCNGQSVYHSICNHMGERARRLCGHMDKCMLSIPEKEPSDIAMFLIAVIVFRWSGTPTYTQSTH